MYLNALLKRFGPEGAGVTWTPNELMITFRFEARDPTNGNSDSDTVSLVIMSNQESADASCDFEVLSFQKFFD
jgi:hypothetical protein